MKRSMMKFISAGAAVLVLLSCVFAAGCTSSDNQPAADTQISADNIRPVFSNMPLPDVMTQELDVLPQVIDMDAYVVLDTDPGTDDAIAYLLSEYLLKRDSLIIGTAGNVPMDLIHTNLLLLHDYLDSKTVFAFGASANLEGDPLYYDGFSGEDGLGNMSGEFKRCMQEKHGLTDVQLEFRLNNSLKDYDNFAGIGRELMRHDKIVYVTLGPQTTLARLILMYPELVDRIEMVYVMGGGFNVTNAPHDSEFNMAGDPLADAVVFGSGLNITLIPLDVTSACILTGEQIREFRDSGKYPEMVSILESGLVAYRQSGQADGFLLHDPTALMCAIFERDFRFKYTNITIDKYGSTREAEEGYPVRLAVSANPEVIYKALSLIFETPYNKSYSYA